MRYVIAIVAIAFVLWMFARPEHQTDRRFGERIDVPISVRPPSPPINTPPEPEVQPESSQATPHHDVSASSRTTEEPVSDRLGRETWTWHVSTEQFRHLLQANGKSGLFLIHNARSGDWRADRYAWRDGQWRKVGDGIPPEMSRDCRLVTREWPLYAELPALPDPWADAWAIALPRESMGHFAAARDQADEDGYMVKLSLNKQQLLVETATQNGRQLGAFSVPIR